MQQNAESEVSTSGLFIISLWTLVWHTRQLPSLFFLHLFYVAGIFVSGSHWVASKCSHRGIAAFCSHFNDAVYWPWNSGTPGWPVHFLESAVRLNHGEKCPSLDTRTGKEDNEQTSGQMGAFDILCSGPPTALNILWRLCGSPYNEGWWGVMDAACMVQWAWKDTLVCGGQYGDEAWRCEKYSNVLWRRFVYRWLSAH